MAQSPLGTQSAPASAELPLQPLADVANPADATADVPSGEREQQAQAFKEQGNVLFAQEKYEEAYEAYSKAVQISPKNYANLSIYLANRAACSMRLENYEQSISDCTAALAISPEYVKALLRRAKSYEHLKKYSEAKIDYEAVLKVDPQNDAAKRALSDLPQLMKIYEEQQKAEAMAKLKEVGNGFLGLFGMSLDNFNFVQDSKTGNYSISMQPPSK